MSDTDNTAPPLNDGVSAAAEAALAQLSKDPAFQSVLQKHLNSSMNSKRAYYDNLPNIVKSRVRALKNIQVDILKLEAQFYEEIQRLEVKYQNLYQPYFDKREQIISGAYEPTPDESNWPDSEDEPDDDDDKQKGNLLLFV
jgi:nucleosome assembly protein 1-like 1